MTELSRGEDYISSSSYIEYIFKRIKGGGIWSVFSNIMRHVRKVTFISAAIRVSGIIFTLLEKSAVLLLLFSSLVILLPAMAVTAVIMGIACAVKYALNHKKMTAWLNSAERIFIYITSSNTSKHHFFMRCAEFDTKSTNTKAIVLCKGNFVAFSEYSEKILKIKPDYYFILKSFYLRNLSKKLIYIALT